jgi:hypothetical protein
MVGLGVSDSVTWGQQDSAAETIPSLLIWLLASLSHLDLYLPSHRQQHPHSKAAHRFAL